MKKHWFMMVPVLLLAGLTIAFYFRPRQVEPKKADFPPAPKVLINPDPDRDGIKWDAVEPRRPVTPKE